MKELTKEEKSTTGSSLSSYPNQDYIITPLTCEDPYENLGKDSHDT
ncbi:17038_t:CDS:2 [Cetraspora pellucida]|uniref:17038_t:CDS:1 n=1 Tax=Cetraspora pellucida TaxID=1433469 RepID=A0A9N9B9G9_9GLOM|nr:17038_t:CDS:2 [Cetraspora pellucida]